MIKFKPCPFCGTGARHLGAMAGFYSERVLCDNCHFHLSPELWECRAPQREPMTTAQIFELCPCKSPSCKTDFALGARAAEAHHGIGAKP